MASRGLLEFAWTQVVFGAQTNGRRPIRGAGVPTISRSGAVQRRGGLFILSSAIAIGVAVAAIFVMAVTTVVSVASVKTDAATTSDLRLEAPKTAAAGEHVPLFERLQVPSRHKRSAPDGSKAGALRNCLTAPGAREQNRRSGPPRLSRKQPRDGGVAATRVGVNEPSSRDADLRLPSFGASCRPLYGPCSARQSGCVGACRATCARTSSSLAAACPQRGSASLYAARTNANTRPG